MIKLNQGTKIPPIGFGTYTAPPRDRVEGAVVAALETGYRLVDTAAVYQNEKFVGNAIIKSQVPRDEIFLTTKVWKDAMRADAVRESIEESLEVLQVEYIDLVLIHRPLSDFNVATWHKMEDACADGLCKAIGVSNFLPRHVEALKETSSTIPAVNQIEYHAFFQRPEIVEYCIKNGIVIEAYSPLSLGKKLDNPKLTEIAKNYDGKSPAQVMLRWLIQTGCVPIPRSLSPTHIRENFNVFDFTLSNDEMDEMNGLNEDFNVIGADPDEPDFR